MSSERPDRSSLEDALRATLAALGDAPAEEPSSPAQRVATLDAPRAAKGGPAAPGQKPDTDALHDALRATLDALEAEKKTPGYSQRGSQGGPAPSRKRRLSVIGAVGIALALAAAVGVGYGLRELGQRPADVSAAMPPRIVVRLKPSESERVSIARAVQALRELQSVSRVDVPYRHYFSRVSFAKGDVERHLAEIRDTELRAALSDTMALHVLAAEAWRAKTLNEKEKWEAVGDDPSVETCAAAKRLVAITDDAPNMSRAQWRGITLAAGVPLLWDCAAERLGEVERGLDNKER